MLWEAAVRQETGEELPITALQAATFHWEHTKWLQNEDLGSQEGSREHFA